MTSGEPTIATALRVSLEHLRRADIANVNDMSDTA